MLDELWQRSQKGRESNEGFSHLRFLYSHEAASPVGIDILPYDWAKKSKYAGFDSLKGNRFELLLDSRTENKGFIARTFMVVEQKDQDSAQVYVNAWDKLIVDPAPFLDIVDRRTCSYEELKENKGQYRSSFGLYFDYLKNKFARGFNWKRFMSDIKGSIGK
jgi:hypothetical protein